ncbi:MAG: response regulator [Paracoccaceae bacterium]
MLFQPGCLPGEYLRGCELNTAIEEDSADAMVILIVDDDATNLFVLEQFLQAEGYTTITATNGVEAVAMYQSHKPPLILMDLSMPVMDGFEATRLIFEAEEGDAPPPVVMAVSANVTPEWRASCLEMGMTDFIEKPINFDALIPMISSISDDVRA